MKRVRIGVVDSGVNPDHPHVGNIAQGVAIFRDGQSSEFHDVLGHGTAVAGLIHLKAPDADLVPVRVFQKGLATSVEVLVRAIDWCVSNDIHIINMSLGTTNHVHEALMSEAVQRAISVGAVIVAAADAAGEPALPGVLPGVLAVLADPAIGEDRYTIREQHGKTVFCASPFPRPIPGVPVERNLHGVSFAVAHVTAWVARLWPEVPLHASWEQVLRSALERTRSA